MKMRKGGKRIFALCIALALVFGALWGSGIMPTHGHIAGIPTEVGDELEMEKADFPGDEDGDAGNKEEEEPASPDEEESDPEDSDAEDSDTDTSDEEEPADSEEAEDEDAASEEDRSADGGEASDGEDADEAADTPDTATESTVEDTEAAETAADGNAADTTELPAEETAADEPSEAAPEDGEAAEIQAETAVPDETAETVEEQAAAAMPEGSLSCRTAGGIMVSASFGENVFPEGATMQATDLSKEEAMDAASDAVDGEVVDAAGADITFYDTQGNEVEPYEGGEVNVSLSLDTPLEDGDLTVVHIDDAGNAEELSASDVDEVTETSASFTATEFSEYLLASASMQDNQKSLIKHVNTSYGGISIAFDLVLESPATLTYDGTEKKPTVENLLFGGRSCGATNYRYLNNTNAGDATIYFTINLNGSPMTVYATTFTIEPRSLKGNSSISIGYGTYDGSPQKPEPTVQCGGKKLTKGTDYSVSYSNNTDADNPGNKATATVTGKGNYTGTIETKFRILQLSLAETGITLSPESCTYDGTAKEPAVTVSYNNKDLDSSNYTVAYNNNTAVGENARVTVTAKGNNCTGSTSKKFTITTTDISDAILTFDPYANIYTGSAIKPAETVTYNGKKLSEGTDYTIAYENNTNVGTATVTVTGNGNYTGSITGHFAIVKKALTGADVTLSSPFYAYDGNAQKPDVTVKVDGETLTKDTDYTVSYSNNVNVGTATATVTGKGNYTGTAETTFTITKGTISVENITLTENGKAVENDTYTYDGNAKTPTVTVKNSSGTLLVEGNDNDYTVSYENNTEAGTATVTVTGMGNYDGEVSVSKDFKINKADLSNSTVTLEKYEWTYSSNAIKPTVTKVTCNGRTLVADTDYTVSYAHNEQASTNSQSAEVIVTAVNDSNYTNSKTENFYIGQGNLADATITLSQNGQTVTDSTYTYDGYAKTPTVTVQVNGVTLTKDSEYTVAYTNNTDAGKAGVIVTGAGDNYAGEAAAKTFIINKKSVSNADITLKENSQPVTDSTYTYDGTEKIPTVTVTIEVNEVNQNNYTVNFRNNTNAGTATVAIAGIGNYTGTATKDFTIGTIELTGNNSFLWLESSDYTYDGTAKKPDIAALYFIDAQKNKLRKLTQGTDYDVSYKNNVNIGKDATVTATGKGNYTGTIETTFTIKGESLGDATITLSPATAIYNGAEQEPTVTVKTQSGATLTQGTDYNVDYFDNKNVGTAGVVITPASESFSFGNMAHFTISQLDLSDPDVSLKLATDDASYIRDYKTKKPLESVSYQGKTIPAANYSVSYTNNIYGPTASVTVTGSDNCKGSASAEFTIHGAGTIAGAEVTLSQDSYTYDGTAKKPGVTVVFDSEELVEDRDYTVSYSDNINAGKATVTIKGIGDYSGTKTVTFTIKGTDTSSAGNSSGSSAGSSSGATTISHSSSSSGSSSDDAYSAGSKGSKASYVVKGKKSVRYDLCMVSSKKKTATVPSKVKIGKKTYKVTAVSAYAFPNDKNLTSVIIGKNVKRIGKNAFCGCTNLKILTIKSRKLSAKGVKKCLKDSSVETIIVPDGTEKHYAKLFAKENSGRGKEVKILSASQAAKKKL